MAVKESTIRMKVVGAEEVASALDKATKDMQRQQKVARDAASQYRKASGTGVSSEEQAELRSTAVREAKKLGVQQGIHKAAKHDLLVTELSNQRDMEELSTIASERMRIGMEKEADAYARKEKVKRDLFAKTKATEAQAEGQSEALTKKQMGRLGGMFVVGRVAGRAAGQIAGDSAVGKMAENFAVAGLMTRSVPWTAAVVGIQLVGAAFEYEREQVKKTREAWRQYGETVLQSVRASANIARSISSTDSLGKAMEQEADRVATARIKLSDERAKIRDEKGMFAKGWTWAKGTSGQLTGEERAMDIEGMFLSAQRARADQQAKERMLIGTRNTIAANAAETALVRAGMGEDSPEKQRRVVEAKIAREDAKMQVDHAARRKAAEIAVQNATADEQTLRRRLEGLDKTTGEAAKKEADDLRPKVAEAQRLLKQTQENAANLPAVLESEAQLHHTGIAAIRDEYWRQREKEDRSIAYEAEDAKLRAMYTGYQLEEELQKAHLARMKRDAGEGPGGTRFKALEEAQGTLRTTEAGRKLESAMARYDPAAALAAHKRQMGEYGGTPEELARLAKMLTTGDMQREIEEDKVRLKLLQKKITKEQAEIELAMLANPLARAGGPVAESIKEKLRLLAAGKEAGRDEATVQALRLQKEDLFIERELKRNRISQSQYDIAKMLHRLTPEDRRDPRVLREVAETAKLMADLRVLEQPMIAAGEASTRYAAGQVDVSRINMDVPTTTLQVTRDMLGELRKATSLLTELNGKESFN